MEFSDTKNCCVASCPVLAEAVACSVPKLRMKAQQRPQSLGGALGGGTRRNALLFKQRLQQFVKRRAPFRSLRRVVGARKTFVVLQTGGTSALTYGKANTGVANTMLLNQRRAVAASFVAHGAGELDLSLALADGTNRGRVDPAFAAHDAPIGMWAEAVWSQWLPHAAFRRLVQSALALVNDQGNIAWASVHGPAAAFVASSLRLGWQVVNAYTGVTEDSR